MNDARHARRRRWPWLLLLAVLVVAVVPVGVLVSRSSESATSSPPESLVPLPPCVDGGPLAPAGGWADVAAAASGDGFVRSIQITSDVPGDLSASEFLLVRVVAADARVPQLYFDTTGDRAQGGWTYQTPVSAEAWDLLVESPGTMFRHVGAPDVWQWERVEVPPTLRWVHEGDTTVVCVPVAALRADGRVPDRVDVATHVDDQWLPAAFLAGASYPPDGERVPSSPVHAPDRLAFAYQWAPWAIRDADPSGGDLTRASELYGAFGHVVLAAGLEQPSHPSHAGTRRLVERLRADHPDQELWGYVSMLHHGDHWYGLGEIAERAGRWADMGVTGIFLDEFDLCEPGWHTCPTRPDGTTVTLTRAGQEGAVDAVHSLGLPVFANAHSIHGALGEFSGRPSPLGDGDGARRADMYLLENPTVWDGAWWSGLDLVAAVARFHDAPRYTARTGVRLAVVDTGAGWVDDEADEGAAYTASWWRAVMAGADAHAFTNAAYSATDELAANLPILDAPSDARDLDERGLRFRGGVELRSDGWVAERDVVGPSGELTGTLRVTVDPATGAVRGGLEAR